MPLVAESSVPVLSLLILLVPLLGLFIVNPWVASVCVWCFFSSLHFFAFSEAAIMYMLSDLGMELASSVFGWFLFSFLSQVPVFIAALLALKLGEKHRLHQGIVGLGFVYLYTLVFVYVPTLFPLPPAIVLMDTDFFLKHSFSAIGAEGFIFFLLSCFFMVLLAIFSKQGRKKSLGLALIFSIFLLGFALKEYVSWNQENNEITKSFKFLSFQPGLYWQPHQKTPSGIVTRDTDLLLFLDRSISSVMKWRGLAEKDVDLLALSETQFLTDATNQNLLGKLVPKMLRHFNLGLITGNETWTQSTSYNSATLWSSNGDVTGVYNKRKLIPIGEYKPFAEFFPSLQPILPGFNKYKQGSSKQKNLFSLNGFQMSFLICYEDIFPEFYRELSQKGADLVFSLSSDRLFQSQSMSRYHRLGAELQALSFRKTLVRLTTDGASSIQLPSGQRVFLGKMGGPYFDYHQLQVPIQLGESLYSRLGQYFSLFSGLLVALSAVIFRWDG